MNEVIGYRHLTHGLCVGLQSYNSVHIYLKDKIPREK